MSDQWYIQPDDLADELEKSQAQGNTPTEKLCLMFLEMAQRYLRKPRYQGYSYHDKEDIAMFALERCIKGVKNYKPSRRKSCFSYYTAAIQNATLEYLDRVYYRQINVKREAMRRYADQMYDINPLVGQRIMEGISEVDSTGEISGGGY